MREYLNLQALKRSKKKKHNTIYNKAKQMIIEGWETEELSEHEVIEIANKYPQLEVNVLLGGDIEVKGKNGTWMIKDEVTFLVLYHRHMASATGKFKEEYHIQDVFYDLDFILASIISHDNYSMGTAKMNREDILQMIEQRA